LCCLLLALFSSAPESFAQPARGLPDLAPVVEASKRAVVNVTVILDESPARSAPAEPSGDPVVDYFRRFQNPAQSPPSRDIGSGFIVGEDGLILTSRHLVRDAVVVSVRLHDRREFKARVIGLDEATDIALIRIAARKLPTLRFGDSHALKPGDWVLAIGSPYGLENTVTAGIVSGTSRSLAEAGFVRFLQTDAAVNPGSSGGPLLNLQGEVVGINSMIYSITGGYQGVAFAIPGEIALRVKDELLANGRVERGRIGIGVQELDQPLAQAFGLESPDGALVNYVEPGGPAHAAGIAAGDVILRVNGSVITNAGELPLAIAETRPGSRLPIELWRQGARRTVVPTVARASSPPVEAIPLRPSVPAPLGIFARALTPDELRSLGLESGLLVEEVSGAAARAGIQEGDVVLSINSTLAMDPMQLRAPLPAATRSVALLILRGDQRLFLAVEPG